MLAIILNRKDYQILSELYAIKLYERQNAKQGICK